VLARDVGTIRESCAPVVGYKDDRAARKWGSGDLHTASEPSQCPVSQNRRRPLGSAGSVSPPRSSAAAAIRTSQLPVGADAQLHVAGDVQRAVEITLGPPRIGNEGGQC